MGSYFSGYGEHISLIVERGPWKQNAFGLAGNRDGRCGVVKPVDTTYAQPHGLHLTVSHVYKGTVRSFACTYAVPVAGSELRH